MRNEEPVSLVSFVFTAATNGLVWKASNPLPGIVDLLELIAYGNGKDEKSDVHMVRLGIASDLPTTAAEFAAADPVFTFPSGVPGVQQGSLHIPTQPAIVSIKGPFRLPMNGRRIVFEHMGGESPATDLMVLLRLRPAPQGARYRKLFA